MKRIIFFLGAVLISGCLVRSYRVEKPRADLDIEGNRGYLIGSPKEEPRELKKTRPVTIFELEFGSHKTGDSLRKSKASSRRKEKSKLSQGEVDIFEEESVKENIVTQVDIPGGEEAEGDSQKGYTTYKVQKNDTLQKISKKFYGTTKKWFFLYKQNKDVLKSPDKLYPGMVIRIPAL